MAREVADASGRAGRRRGRAPASAGSARRRGRRSSPAGRGVARCRSRRSARPPSRGRRGRSARRRRCRLRPAAPGSRRACGCGRRGAPRGSRRWPWRSPRPSGGRRGGSGPRCACRTRGPVSAWIQRSSSGARKCHVGRIAWVRTISPASKAAPTSSAVVPGGIRWATAHIAPGTSCDWTAPNQRTTSTADGRTHSPPSSRLARSRAWAIARLVTLRVYGTRRPGPDMRSSRGLRWRREPRARRLGRRQPGPGRGLRRLARRRPDPAHGPGRAAAVDPAARRRPSIRSRSSTGSSATSSARRSSSTRRRGGATATPSS